MDGLLQAARDRVGYVDLRYPEPPPKAPPPSEAPHVKAMRAISTQAKVDAGVDGKKKNGEPRKREENSFEAFMRKHLHDLGGDRKFVTQVYHAAQEHGIQQVADEKLRFLNISPANRTNINDPTHDALSKETLRVNAAWTSRLSENAGTAFSIAGECLHGLGTFQDTVRCQGERQSAYGLHASFL